MSMQSILEKCGHESNKTGSPGFHGKYDRKTGGNKPTTRDDKYPRYNGGKTAYRYVPIVLGSVVRSSNSVPGPSYATIKPCNKTMIEGFEYRVCIDGDRVILNDLTVTTAPAHLTNSKKETFLKAVVWQLLHDPESLKEKYDEITTIKDPVPITIPAAVQEPAIAPVIQYHGPVMPINRYGYIRCVIHEVPA